MKTTTTTDQIKALTLEADRLRFSLCHDMDMSGWATGYADRLREIKKELARLSA